MGNKEEGREGARWRMRKDERGENDPIDM